MIKKFCVAAMALCMMLSCAQKQQQKEEAAAPATTLSGLNPADFTSEVDGKPIAFGGNLRRLVGGILQQGRRTGRIYRLSGLLRWARG